MRLLVPAFIFLVLRVSILFAGDKVSGMQAAPAVQPGFKENKNQWDSRTLFMAELNGARIYLHRTGITYVLYDRKDLEHIHPAPGSVTVHGHVYKVDFVGADAAVEVQKSGASENYYNYFIGNKPERWASHVHSYNTVYYKNIYPGIDVKFYFINNLIKYDFIVHPGADASLIKLKYTGADGLFLKEGSLHVKTSVGETVEALPVSYQSDHLTTTVNVKSKYKLKEDVMSFDFPKGYDVSRELIIDPTLIFSTFTGSFSDNFGFTSTYDRAGNMYLGGLVNDYQSFGGPDFYPVTTGAFQAVYGGGDTNGGQYPSDISISKLNPTGTAYVYSTYLGGVSNETPHSLFVNSNNELVIYGRSFSPDYPVAANAYQPIYRGNGDIVVTILSQDGSNLVGSTFLGGSEYDGVNFDPTEQIGGILKVNYADDARGEVVCDAQNNIYIASCTSSDNFPVTPGAYQNVYHGLQDGVLFKMSSNASQLIYSTYLGGNSADACYSISLKKSDNSVYTTGGTMSSDFPTTAGVINRNYMGGSSDGFLAHLSANGQVLQSSTFLGTNSQDQSYCVKLDADENVYAMGQTFGDYPVTAGVYSNPFSGQFITKLKPRLDSVYFSTVFGSGTNQPNISPTAFLVDTCGNIYVCGWGGTLFFGFWPFNTNDMFGMPVTADAYQPNTDGNDFYIIVLNRDARKLLYATYFGGDGAQEHVDGGTSRFDERGIIYEAICAGCGGNSFTPTTAGVISRTNNSPNCNELGFKIDLGQLDVRAASLANPVATGCKPLTVAFVNQSQNGIFYHWNFDTGLPKDTSNKFQPSFTFTDTGTYNIRLIAENPDACYPRDTAYTQVKVYDSHADASFTHTDIDYCDSFKVDFQSAVSGTSVHFTWDFGDGGTSTLPSPTHVYTYPGVYTVRLILKDDTACNGLDTVEQTINYISKIIASLNVDSLKGCTPYTVNLTNQGFGSNLTYTWDFGDGTTSSSPVGTHTYNNAGDYVLKLIINKTASCNHSDTSVVHVKVSGDRVTAAVPNPAGVGCAPLLVSFVNQSSNSTSWHWDFGTGNSRDTSSLFEPVFNFTRQGSYRVMLVSRNNALCFATDTTYTFVKVNDSRADASFTFTVNDFCDSLRANFIPTMIGKNNLHYQWDFGDSSFSTLSTPSHTYYTPGYYIVRLVLNDDTACHPWDTAYLTVAYTSRIDAKLNYDALSGCPPFTVDLRNTGFGQGLTYQWTFGDGSTSTDSVGAHIYQYPGTYTARLVIRNPASCNVTDTTFIIIEVLTQNIVAAFSADPEVVTKYGPVRFTNLSTGATSYIWNFGDSESSFEVNPEHLYQHTGAYLACLYAYNGNECPGQACRQISILFDPNVGVPNAFSPNGDGENDVLYVRGQGVRSMLFRVFNRWGQLVFETKDLSIGWDGRFKGAPQDMDVYAWTLEALLDTNETIKKNGNVTLLR